MLAYNVTDEEIRNAAERASKLYSGNVVADIRGRTGRAIRFGLRVRDSRGDGAHRSANGRRTRSACFHAHADFFRALFGSCPNARVKTAFAHYHGGAPAQYERDFDFVGMREVGSAFRPMQLRECCECAGGW